MKKITLLFTLFFGIVASAQFSENFDGATTAPAGWTVINGGGANGFIFGVGAPGSAFSAPNAAQINYNATAHDDYLVTPAITVTAGLNDRLTYYVKNQDPAYVESYAVRLSSTTPTAAAFTVTVTPEAEAPNVWTQFTIDLTPYLGQTIYIGFHAVSTDKFRLLFDDVVNDTPPALAPNCATLTAPADEAVDVPYLSLDLAWTAPTTGGPVSSYDVYLDTNIDPTTLLGNQTALTRTITDLMAETTYYWKVIAKNSAGEAVDCSIFSFTTMAIPGYCLNSPFGQWPTGTFTTANCDGVTVNTVTTAGYAGEYSSVQVVSGTTYVFSSGTTDLITISTDGGATAAAFGTTPLTWVSNYTGDIRFYSHLSELCEGEDVNRTRSFVCGTLSNESPDYANLQFPSSATITQGDSAVIYAQVYHAGLTDVEPGLSGQADGIQAWIGISPVGANTDPATWSNWVSATFNAGHVSNNDEYQASIGANLAPGTYYYASRFRLNDGVFVYGGINASDEGNFWDGTTYLSGVLTVTPPPVPNNDECATPTPLTAGAVFATNPLNTTNFGATLSSQATPSCGAFNFDTVGKDVWYSVTVPASGNITIETKGNGGLSDTVMQVYTGECDSLVTVECDDDDGDDNFSLISLTGRTEGEVLIIRVWGYNGASGNFDISAYDASLSTGSFDNAGFKYYPNPVKDVLNLSYISNISSVSVVNLLGQQVLTKNVNANESQLDLSTLTAGTYLVKITTEDNLEKTIKIVKQ
ncbi:choice-of-anchor J domain-containing protein [Flavobacterium azooxidireducens]|uniref:Choice-of-anchor J domain-containing protein n=1 Tax=Flavobacterium azooxidireducens TaxID=1871076 RepID=A0ABY4KEW9_9FLAO|nr:choice-of-anchor J domain-containing protein [Flavobacterium azooxidireducens]UPQ79368.1 choice-of-anchor J domain-containing protein [Flavobacterium azooxidireducens]